MNNIAIHYVLVVKRDLGKEKSQKEIIKFSLKEMAIPPKISQSRVLFYLNGKVFLYKHVLNKPFCLLPHPQKSMVLDQCFIYFFRVYLLYFCIYIQSQTYPYHLFMSFSIFHQPEMKNSQRTGVRQYNKSEFPRLRWTPELHDHFVEVVERLGGKYSKPLFFLYIIKSFILAPQIYMFVPQIFMIDQVLQKTKYTMS